MMERQSSNDRLNIEKIKYKYFQLLYQYGIIILQVATIETRNRQKAIAVLHNPRSKGNSSGTAWAEDHFSGIDTPT